jgi:serine/threonine protein kinase
MNDPTDRPEHDTPAEHLAEAADAASALDTDDLVQLRARLGACLPDYELGACLGRGGMGAVFRAVQRRLDREVAIKVLLPPPGEVAGWTERFEREARTLARLSHPGIVAVHDFGSKGDLVWIVMELVEGTNLRELMGDGRLEPAEALAIVPAICEALQYAHDNGVVHRDIKPENVLLDTTGRVKLVDFGLAKLQNNGDPHLTRTDQAMGTPRYMAPEQIEHPLEVDHRADIFSLGVVFYEMLTGQVPAGVIEPPSRKVKVDVRLDEVVLRALEREPARRYQRASEIETGIRAASRVDLPSTASEGSPAPTEGPTGPPAAEAPTTGPALGGWGLIDTLAALSVMLLWGVHRLLLSDDEWNIAAWTRLAPEIGYEGPKVSFELLYACLLGIPITTLIVDRIQRWRRAAGLEQINVSLPPLRLLLLGGTGAIALYLWYFVDSLDRSLRSPDHYIPVLTRPQDPQIRAELQEAVQFDLIAMKLLLPTCAVVLVGLAIANIFTRRGAYVQVLDDGRARIVQWGISIACMIPAFIALRLMVDPDSYVGMRALTSDHLSLAMGALLIVIASLLPLFAQLRSRVRASAWFGIGTFAALLFLDWGLNVHFGDAISPMAVSFGGVALADMILLALMVRPIHAESHTTAVVLPQEVPERP